MDAKILEEIATMRAYMFIALLLAGFVVFAIAIPALSALWRMRRLRAASEFSVIGNILLHKAELDKLDALCKTRLHDFPEDVNAFWLKGLVHYRREEWVEALSCFRKVEHLQPGTGARQSIVDIEEKMAMAPRSPGLKLVSSPESGPLGGPGGSDG